MAHHQLPDGQRGQLDLGGGREHLIARRRQLVRVHAAEHDGARIPDHPPVHLRAKLLGTEQHQSEVAAALRNIEQHLLDVGLGSIGGRVLVQLVHEHDHRVDAQVAALEALAELRHHAGEHEVLSQGIHVRHVHDVHGAVVEPPPRQIVRRAVVGDQTLAACRDVRQAVANLAHGGDVVRPPAVAPATRELEPVEDRPEQPLQIGKRDHAMHAAEPIFELLVHDPVGQEVDEGVGLGVDVVPVEQHLGVVEHLAQPPHQRLDVADQIGMGPQRVQVHAVGLEGRIVAHPAERLRLDAQALVAPAVLVLQRAGPIEEAQVGALHVEAHRAHATLVGREMLEDGGQQELHGARLGGEPRDARDVQVRRFRAEQEVRVDVHGRFESARGIETHRDRRGLRAAEIGVHAERLCHVDVARDVHLPKRDRLQRLLWGLPKHRRGPEPDLLPDSRTLGGLGRVALGADDVVQGCGEIGVGEPIRHHAPHHLSRFPVPASRLFHAHNRPDPDGRLVRGPEVELVRGRRLLLSGDDAADRGSQVRWMGRIAPLDHEAVLGSREPGCGMRDAGCEVRSDGARALRYVSTSWIG